MPPVSRDEIWYTGSVPATAIRLPFVFLLSYLTIFNDCHGANHITTVQWLQTIFRFSSVIPSQAISGVRHT
jgi:hypothetical protein